MFAETPLNVDLIASFQSAILDTGIPFISKITSYCESVPSGAFFTVKPFLVGRPISASHDCSRVSPKLGRIIPPYASKCESAYFTVSIGMAKAVFSMPTPEYLLDVMPISSPPSVNESAAGITGIDSGVGLYELVIRVV